MQYALLDLIQILLKFGGISVLLLLAIGSDIRLKPGMVLVWFAIGPLVVLFLFLPIRACLLLTVPIVYVLVILLVRLVAKIV